MKNWKFTLALFMGLSLPLPHAFAADWYLLYTSTENDRWFFDLQSVEKDELLTRIWIVTVQRHKPDQDGNWGTSRRMEFNCPAKKYRLSSDAELDKNGDVNRTYLVDPTFHTTSPGSVIEAAYEIICKKDFPLNPGRDYTKIPENNPMLATRRLGNQQ